MFRKSLIGTAFAAATLIGAGSAQAVKPGTATLTCDFDMPAVIDDCGYDLRNLCAVTEAAGQAFGGSLKDRDQQTLISKVIGISEKINQDKFDDADEKLFQFEQKLDDLINAPKPKISEDDADAISGALTPAQVCVFSLG